MKTTKICEQDGCTGTILTGFEEDGDYYDYCDTCGAYTAPYDPDNEPVSHIWNHKEDF